MKKTESGFFSIIIPLLVIILLFFITVFVVILPYIRSSLIENETSQLKHLIEQQIQILDSLNEAAERGDLSIEQAKATALELLVEQRYGKNQDFYYWITDLQPVLLMHPFRSDLVNQYVGDFKDPKGNFLFSDMVEIVDKDGEGYLEYVWQLPYDSETLIDKQSFVKLFEPWGWIVGTGFYIDQLSSEIKNLFLVISILSFIVFGMIILISYYLFRQRMLLRRKNLFYVRNFQESEKRYKELIGRMNEGFVLVDKDLQITMANQKILTMLGKSEQSVIGVTFESFIRDESLETYRQNVSTRKEGQNRSYEVELKDGKNGYITVIVSPMGIFNEKNEFVGSFAVFTDISKLKNTQRELEHSLEERDGLLQEIHHRVKNNLQIVISLLHLQRMKHESTALDKFLVESESRILSISLVHELLYETQSFDSIDFGIYLDRILEHLREEFINDAEIQVDNRFSESRISADSATSSGIIYSELIMKFFGLLSSRNDTAYKISKLRIESYCSDDDYIISFIGIYDSDISPELFEGAFDLNLVSILTSQLNGEFNTSYSKSDNFNKVIFKLVFPDAKKR